MLTTIIEHPARDRHRLAETFLSEYGATLLACGATCIRLEKNINRIASRLNVKADMTIMPRHLHLTVSDPEGMELFTSITTIPARPISYNLNSSLSKLSWEIADGKCSLHQAMGRLKAAIRADRQKLWIPLLTVPLANASFCHLFGGDAVAMLIVAVATFAGYFLKQRLTELHCDVRVIFMVCAFVSAVLGASDGLFALGSTPMLSIGTSVLYLVPGIPFLNALSDMIYRHYICALSRFTDAIVLTASLSIGLCAAMALMHTGMF